MYNFLREIFPILYESPSPIENMAFLERQEYHQYSGIYILKNIDYRFEYWLRIDLDLHQFLCFHLRIIIALPPFYMDFHPTGVFLHFEV